LLVLDLTIPVKQRLRSPQHYAKVLL